jgi:hypothetical protein
VSTYPDARRVVLSIADLRRLTVLERARACALAGVAESDIGELLRAIASRKGDPDELERGVLLLYALAYQLERRLDRDLTWEQAQELDLALDLQDGAEDPIAEAEARASVETALATGLSPADAGELTLAQLDAYRSVRAEQARAARPRTRRARVGR